ncbi:MAG: peptidoglycan editing factor PgeF [Thermodesulfobacteriota bacterium]
MTDQTSPDHIPFRWEERLLQGGSVPLFRFDHFARQANLEHAVFTRLGGVSEHPCRSLNVSSRTPDQPAFVRANLELVREALGADRLVMLDQAHGGEVIAVRRGDRDRLEEPLKGDALVTDVPGLGLVIKQADCQAVILYDPVRRVVANIHCGWRGSVANILHNAVKCMEKVFGCRPCHLLAGVGPSLGPCCAEFKGHEEIFPQSFRPFMAGSNHFDLWALSTHQLTAAGVEPSRIALSGLCTRCRTDLFFSYRGEGVTGRFATAAMIRD